MVVWLERDGVRCVEPDRSVPLPSDTMERLVYNLARERENVERYWVSDMIEWGSISVEHTGMCWAVRVYPGTDSERVVPFSVAVGNLHRFDVVEHAALHDEPPAVVLTLPDGGFNQRFLKDLIWRNR